MAHPPSTGSFEHWLRDAVTNLTTGPDASARGRHHWVHCPDLGVTALSMNLVFERDVFLDQQVPPGSYISLTGHCDFLPDGPLHETLRSFDHTLSAVELTDEMPDAVHFKAGGRLQMIRLNLAQQPDSPLPMPAGRDPAFLQETGYQSARIRALPADLHALCLQLWQCDWTGQSGALFAQAKIREILAHLLRKPWQAPHAQKQLQLVARAQAIILNDLGDHWPVQRVARMLGTNDCYVKQAFRQQLGIGMAAWVRQARMYQAHQWLADTTWPITRISTEVGYSAPGRFAAVFERHFGMRPSDYRKQCQ